MSYNIYVTYKKHWIDKAPALDIPKERFIAFVKKHPLMKLVEPDYPHIVQAICQPPGSHYGFTIEWEEGLVRTNARVVPQEVFVVLAEFAAEIKANVQGEEGEFYKSDDTDAFLTLAAIHTMEVQTHIDREKAAKNNQKRYRIQRILIIIGLSVLGPLGWIILPFALYKWRKRHERKLSIH